MKELSQKKNYEIANVCYANILEAYLNLCVKDSDLTAENYEKFERFVQSNNASWCFIHGIKGNKELIADRMQNFTDEILSTIKFHLNNTKECCND
jgi:hypothetical protein